MLRSRRHDLSLCLRADRWPRDNVYRLLIKGLTRLHDEKRTKDLAKDTFTDNNIKRQKKYLMGIPCHPHAVTDHRLYALGRILSMNRLKAKQC